MEDGGAQIGNRNGGYVRVWDCSRIGWSDERKEAVMGHTREERWSVCLIEDAVEEKRCRGDGRGGRVRATILSRPQSSGARTRRD